MKSLYVALSLILFALPAFAQDNVPTGTCAYQKLAIDNLSTPSGMNDLGAIVGSVFSRTDSTTHAFLLFKGKITIFRFPGSEFSTASSINNHSQIVGTTFFTGDRDIKGYVVRDGAFHLIVVPNSEGNDAADISDEGDIVGNLTTKDGVPKGYLLHNGTFHIFRFPGSAETHVTGINRDGIIIGNYRSADVNSPIHGFMVKNGNFTTLDFPGAQFTFPNKINNEGEIIGFYEGQGLSHGFAFDKGKFRELNDPPDSHDNAPTGVNNRDKIVTVRQFPFTESFIGNCLSAF